MKLITLQNLCNLADAVIINSEPYFVYDEVFEQGLIHFVNQNTGEQFCLNTDAEPVAVNNNTFTFHTRDLMGTVDIEFYKHTPLDEEDL